MHTATAESEIPAAGPPTTYAGVGGRFVALLLDGLALIGFFFLLGGVFVMLFGGKTEGGFEFTGIVGAVFITIELVLVTAYFVVCEARWGATPGKLAAGMRVRSTAGGRIGYGASFIRNLLRIVDVLPVAYLVGAISVWVTKRSQRVGDLVAGAVVVRRESGGGPRTAALAGVIAVGVGGVLLGMALMQLGAGREAEAPGSKSAAVVPQPPAAASESGSIETESSATTPWSGRGWVQREDDTYVNPEHDLKLVVPDGWTIFDEGSRAPQFLWLMGKLEPDGKQRMFTGVFAEDLQGMSDEQWFDAQIQFIRDATLTIGNQTQPAFEILRTGETEQPGVHQIRFTRIDNGMRGHQLFFVRDGVGYTVTRNASADASAEEIADLETIRQSMGLR